jgi:hypothetical protein
MKPSLFNKILINLVECKIKFKWNNHELPHKTGSEDLFIAGMRKSCWKYDTFNRNKRDNR